MNKEQAFTAILEQYNKIPDQEGQRLNNQQLKPYKLNKRFTSDMNYQRIYTREGDDWHWLSIRIRGTDAFIATKTEADGRIFSWDYYRIRGDQLILDGKERIEKNGQMSFKHQLGKKITELKQSAVTELIKHRKRGEQSL